MSTKTIDADALDWEKVGGLIPAIVQDAKSGTVLMLGYMDRAALAKTESTGKVTFLSRKSGKLWTKGETSGHFLDLVSISHDCDQDALLVLANPNGPTCHEGTLSCFGDIPPFSHGFLSHLEGIINARAGEPADSSYTASLLQGKIARVAQKVGEEGLEVALATVGADDIELLGEAADLVYHLLVALKARDQSLADVTDVLRSRHASKTK